MKTQGRGEATGRGHPKRLAKGRAHAAKPDTDGRAKGRATQAKRPAPSPVEPPPHVRRGRSDDGTAFMPDPSPADGVPARIDDSLAENLAEEFVEAVTGGDDPVEEALEAVVPEELGGPFVVTSAADEFAHDIDAANPEDAEREPLPRPVAGLVQSPDDLFDEGALDRK